MEGMIITVGQGLAYDYTTIGQALDAVPYHTKATIRIAKGVYREKLFSDKEDITLIGSGMDETKIVWDDAGLTMLPEGRKRGTFRSYTAFFSGERLHLEDLAIINDAGFGPEIGQAVALYLDVRDSRLLRVALRAHQDTLFLAPLPEKVREKGGFYGPRVLNPRLMTRTVMEDGLVEGNVDFIFGGGDALFSNCTIISNGPGYVTAPSGWHKDRGLVFDHCKLERKDCPQESVFLMRPWRPEGKSTFLSSSYGSHIKREGYSRWHDQDDPFVLAEYGDTSPYPMVRTAPAIQLTKEEAEALVRSFEEKNDNLR